MAYFAPKIFSDRTHSAIAPILKLVTPSRGLETALYNFKSFEPATIDAISNLPTNQKMHHLWHRTVALNVFNSPEADSAFIWEAEQCKDLGINRAVIHNMFSDRPVDLGEPRKFANEIIFHLDRAFKKGIRLYIENTYESFEFMQDLFEHLYRMDVNDITGFCLDTGHVRALSNGTLDQWGQMAGHLYDCGFGVHYHLHANDGTGDQHINLSRAYTEELLSPVPEWTPAGYIPWLASAIKATPTAIMCLENSMEDASDALGFIELLQSGGALPK